MDKCVALLLVLIMLTLTGWVIGWWVYPFGLMVMLVMLAGRLLQLVGRRFERGSG